MKARQHIPGYIDIERELDASCETLDELLALPWVKRWSAQDDFVQWELASDHKPPLLMARMKGAGWVVAYLSGDGDKDPPSLALPRWQSEFTS